MEGEKEDPDSNNPVIKLALWPKILEKAYSESAKIYEFDGLDDEGSKNRRKCATGLFHLVRHLCGPLLAENRRRRSCDNRETSNCWSVSCHLFFAIETTIHLESVFHRHVRPPTITIPLMPVVSFEIRVYFSSPSRSVLFLVGVSMYIRSVQTTSPEKSNGWDPVYNPQAKPHSYSMVGTPLRWIVDVLKYIYYNTDSRNYSTLQCVECDVKNTFSTFSGHASSPFRRDRLRLKI